MRKFKQAPLLEKVLIEDYAAEGKALARVDGKVIFVEGAVPGDVVDIQLQKNKSSPTPVNNYINFFHSSGSGISRFICLSSVADLKEMAVAQSPILLSGNGF